MIADYVGIPFELHGTDRRGLDCWGLVRLYHLEQRGLKLPSFGDRYGRELDLEERRQIAAIVRGASDEWQPVKAGTERRGDVVLFKMAGAESHLGIVVGEGRFLHARPGTDSCVESYKSLTWSRRVAGFWRR
jgi:cell wall-associated NlpC family hydrolase